MFFLKKEYRNIKKNRHCEPKAKQTIYKNACNLVDCHVALLLAMTYCLWSFTSTSSVQAKLRDPEVLPIFKKFLKGFLVAL